MTSNKGDYLKAIYESGGGEEKVQNKVIADKLGVTPASVSEMITKMQKQGLVEYTPYKGTSLTQKGLKTCIELIRSHRIWEVFLMEYLGYSWREAHEDAHILEHATPSRMVDRLDLFLNHPATCPHGSVIPQKGKGIEKSILYRLSDMKVGDELVISRIIEDGKLLDYLQEVGLEIGKSVKLVSFEPYEGPVTFEQDGRPISISYKAATQIYVR